MHFLVVAILIYEFRGLPRSRTWIGYYVDVMSLRLEVVCQGHIGEAVGHLSIK